MEMPMPVDPIASIPKRKLRSLLKNPVKTAEAVNLVYRTIQIPVSKGLRSRMVSNIISKVKR